MAEVVMRAMFSGPPHVCGDRSRFPFTDTAWIGELRLCATAKVVCAREGHVDIGFDVEDTDTTICGRCYHEVSKP